MTFTDALTYLEQLKPAGMQMGLERMLHASQTLGYPEHAFRTVHIAGTNGKGSTARMIAAMLTANGYRTGLYTSPCVTTLCDMILIDGKPISEQEFADCVERVATAVPQGLSEYECLTAAVYCYFQSRQVDIAVIECCLGGRDDATNSLPPPLCAVFTPIALDHTAILGNTLEEIAGIKSGIVKTGCDVVCAPTMPAEVLGVIMEATAEKGDTLYMPSYGDRATVDRNGTHFVYGDNKVQLSLIGKHQHENALTALEVMRCLQHRGYRSDESVSIKALANVTMPCRTEILSREPFVMLDGAHNPHGITALCDTLRLLELQNITLVIGMLTDKDVDTCLQMLAPFCGQIFCCTPPDTPRAMTGAELATVAAKYHQNVHIIDDPVCAYSQAKKNTDHSIVVGGSFYTAGAVRRSIQNVI